MCQKGFFWNPLTCSSENGKYVGSIIVDSAVICNEIKDMTKTIPTKSTSAKCISTKCTLTNFLHANEEWRTQILKDFGKIK